MREPMMFETRYTPEAIEAIGRLEEQTNPELFLHMVADALQIETWKVRWQNEGYSPATGERVEWGWAPCDKFNGTIYTHGGFRGEVTPSYSVAAKLASITKPLFFVHEGKVFIVSPFNSGWNGTTVHAGVTVTEALTLESLRDAT